MEGGADGDEEVDFVGLGLLEDSVGEAEIVWGHFEMGEGFLISFAVDGLLGVYFVFKVFKDFHVYDNIMI